MSRNDKDGKPYVQYQVSMTLTPSELDALNRATSFAAKMSGVTITKSTMAKTLFAKGMVMQENLMKQHYAKRVSNNKP